MSRYPQYPSQPYTGTPPSMWSDVNRASDTRYSSSTAPHYQALIDKAHGRHLAGTDDEVQDEKADSGFALNELRLMAEMDDVQNNGVFDNAAVTPPNIHGDAGVFSVRFSLPGYLARERMFHPSEVRDVTTGRPIVVVPNSPIAFDTSAQVAFIERGLNQPFAPVVQQTSRGAMPFQSITNVVQNPEQITPGGAPISGLGLTGMDGKKAALLAGGAAVAVGALWYFLKGPGKTQARNSRKSTRRRH